MIIIIFITMPMTVTMAMAVVVAVAVTVAMAMAMAMAMTMTMTMTLTITIIIFQDKLPMAKRLYLVQWYSWSNKRQNESNNFTTHLRAGCSIDLYIKHTFNGTYIIFHIIPACTPTPCNIYLNFFLWKVHWNEKTWVCRGKILINYEQTLIRKC